MKSILAMPKEGGKMKVGVLALQGSVDEHLKILNQIEGVEAFTVRTPDEVLQCDGLILPGGESTAIGKLLVECNIKDVLQQKILNGMPVWGTCAGMILLAKKIANDDRTHLGTMDVVVRRNAYGAQVDSFSALGAFKGIEGEVPLVFIRAPYIESIGSSVQVLSEVDGNIVAAQQENMLVTSFHPELTKDLRVHQYFVDMIKK